MASGARAAAPPQEEDKLLDEALNVVKQQSFNMKRCLDQDKLMDALKHCSNMICELRTSLLNPTAYYKLYIDVSMELRYLERYLTDLHRSGKRVGDLYELVQYAGNILPRLYLVVTVGSVYIKTKEAPAKDILRDMVEMLKGVQHPTRGLFLRNYLSQMTKDKLPDVGSEYNGEGGSVADSVEFILQNFTEMNKLWVRLGYSTGSSARKGAKREEERMQLRMLVATNLERLSQLEGVTVDMYVKIVLPRVLEQIVSCKDALAQQCLMESLVACFADNMHLHTLDKLLDACGLLQPNVDIKKIIIGLIDRLATYAKKAPESVPTDINMFDIFSTHIGGVIKARTDMPVEDILMLQVALLNLSLQCYPANLENVNNIMGYCASVLTNLGVRTVDSNPACGKQLVQLLNVPVDTYKNILTVLELENYPKLLEFLGHIARKLVAVYIVNNVLKYGTVISEVDHLTKLLDLLKPLLKDEEDMGDPAKEDQEDFADEQTLMARLIQLIKSPQLDMQFQLIVTARKMFSEGGERRIQYTLVPLIFHAIKLTQQYLKAKEEDELWEKKAQKIFQYIDQTIGPLTKLNPDLALRLYLQSGVASNKCGFEAATMNSMTNAFTVYEESMPDSRQQLAAITLIIGSLHGMGSLSEENFDALTANALGHAMKLLKIPDRCRAVYMITHLSWCPDRTGSGHDARKVLENLQKALKVADKGMQASMNVALFVDILNEYLYFFEQKVEAVQVKYLDGLIQLINTNIAGLEASDSTDPTASHYRNTLAHIRYKAQTGADAARYAEIRLDAA